MRPRSRSGWEGFSIALQSRADFGATVLCRTKVLIKDVIFFTGSSLKMLLSKIGRDDFKVYLPWEVVL